jgi:hypothetical protein
MDTLSAIFAKMDERVARQDEILAKMDERLERQNELLAHVVTLIDIARQEATAAHQTVATAIRQYAETRLDVDRFITTAERVLASWERQQR